MTRSSEVEARAATWLIRREAPDFSAAEQEQLERWLHASPRHRSAFLRLEAAWRRADQLRKLRPLDGRVDENLLKTSPLEPLRRTDTLGGIPERRRAEPQVPGARRRTWSYGLAAALAVLVAGLLAWATLQPLGWQRYRTDLGGFQRIELPDGSTVEINTDSQIRVRFTRERRDVALDRGEALFTVAHDAERPFDVEASGTTVRAVGTVFAVRLGSKKDVEVIVKEGRVAIDPPKHVTEPEVAVPAAVATLSAGEKVTIRAEPIRVVKVAEPEVKRKLSWTEGQLIFDRQTLAEVVAEFNRYNRRQLVIADPAISTYRVGGTFSATDPESFVAALGVTYGVRPVPSLEEEPDAEVIYLHGSL